MTLDHTPALQLPANVYTSYHFVFTAVLRKPSFLYRRMAFSLVEATSNVMVLPSTMDTVGGVLVYGIPEFRLPKSIVQTSIERLKSW